MPIFKCENPDLEKVLLDLYTLVIEHGGYIHDNVTVLEEQGNLSILSSLPKDNHEELIVLPDSCLPRIRDFSITNLDDKLKAKPKSPGVSESHVMAMQLMMEIYNITNKLSKHRETCPWLALENYPALVQKLFEARSSSAKVEQYYEYYKSKKFDELLIDSYIGSRALNIKSDNEEGPYLYFMPFIDFMNHHYASPGYIKSNNNTDGLAVKNFVSMSGSQECFVNYSILDSFDTFLLFDFIDIMVPFVRSVPLEINIPELGTIKVKSNILPLYNNELPDPVKDLRTYIPFAAEGTDNEMQLSHLMIPGRNAPLALRRVLTFYMRGWKPKLAPEIVNGVVIDMEKSIIHENVTYYTNLSYALEAINGDVASKTITNSVKLLVEQQMIKLRQYQERIFNLG